MCTSAHLVLPLDQPARQDWDIIPRPEGTGLSLQNVATMTTVNMAICGVLGPRPAPAVARIWNGIIGSANASPASPLRP